MPALKSKKSSTDRSASKRVASKSATAKVKRSDSTPPDFSDFNPLPPVDVLLRIVQDAVYSRIRHRALLDVLASGKFDPGAYLRKFRELVDRDYKGLYAKLVLADEDFVKLHGEWLAEDELRYRVFFDSGFVTEQDS